LLLDAGLTLPKDVLLDHRFRGMSAERIYNLLEEQETPGGPEEPTDRNDQSERQTEPSPEPSMNTSGNVPDVPITPGGCGQVLDAPAPKDGSIGGGDSNAGQAREWQIAVQQAESLAKQAGKVPAGIERTLYQSRNAAVDWRELLRRAWSETIAADYSWMRPNRRHVWAGLYLPGIVCEGVGEIAIAVDCSGSVGSRQLGLFEAEIRSILEGQRPQQVHVLYFDTEVHKTEVYQAGQPIHLNPVGGGGTDFRPCFTWLEDRGIVPQTLVFLTDLCGTFPDQAPTYPVLWASTESRRAPFGQVIPMEAA
jgi:predicted metal-dependent peptidase